MPTRPVTVAVSITLALMALAVVAFDPNNQCRQGVACQPWNPASRCEINGRMELQFLLQQWPGNDNVLDEVAYSFCPVVDQLQAYKLNNTGNNLNLGNAFIDFPTVGPRVNETFLRVYGQGAAPNYTHPDDRSWSRVTYASANGCPGDQIAVVSYLSLNFTMSKGDYLYPTDSNNSQPINVGFAPTCDWAGYCLFDDSSICIGAGNLRNCARCYTNATYVYAHTNIWASYYGTDDQGKPFTSGEDNPLNFKQYTVTSAYDVLANSF